MKSTIAKKYEQIKNLQMERDGILMKYEVITPIVIICCSDIQL